MFQVISGTLGEFRYINLCAIATTAPHTASGGIFAARATAAAFDLPFYCHFADGVNSAART